jgi:parvulin-like peptidyl-prolyl isomerase
MLEAGAEIDSLIARYGDPNERSSLTSYAQDRLPPEYRQALQGAQVGDIVGPFQLSIPGMPGKWIVAKLSALEAGGEWTLDDVRESIRQQIQQERMLRRVVDDLRESTYIEIRFEGLPPTG